MKSFKITIDQKKTILQNTIHFEKKKGNNFYFFFAKWKQITIHLYENNTILLQGNSEQIQSFINQYQLEYQIKKKQKFKTTVKKEQIPYLGCDESGVGDLFGPIVISIFYLNAEMATKIKNWKLFDSKQMSQTNIEKLAPQLMANPNFFATKIISNHEFNQNFTTKMNLKELLTFYYSSLIKIFIDTKPHQEIIIDGYIQNTMWKKHCQKLQLQNNFKIQLVSQAENQYLAVAAASIISRFLFLQEINKIGQKIGQKIPLGANQNVKMLIKQLFTKFPKVEMNKIVKLGYKGVKD